MQVGTLANTPYNANNMLRHLQRSVRAQLRDLRVLWQESGNSLLLFLLIVAVGATLFRYFYILPDQGRHPGWGEALHASFALVFFEIVFPLPDEWWLQLLYFFIPIVGLTVAADGVVRVGAALFNKQSRGQKWQVAMASTFNKHIVVCGLGKVGWRTCQQLLKFGRDVVGIDINESGEFIEEAKRAGIPVIIADARRADTLMKAAVEKADAIVPATDDEMTNLDIALDARELNPTIKVVLRMFDEDLARRVERGFGIRTAFSASAIAAPIFAASAMRFNVEHSFYVGNTLLNVSQIKVQPKSALNGLTIDQIQKNYDLSIVSYQSGDQSNLHPAPTQHVKSGDTILVLASIPSLEKVNASNG